MAATRSVIARGNVAVITGGASGIGRAIATRLAAEGMRLVLADIDEPKLRAAGSSLAESGADVESVVCDTTAADDLERLAATTIERFGAAHLLCNNAGVAGVGDPWRGPVELWERVVGVNLFGVVHGVRAFLPILEDQGIGHIVNTASIAGLVAGAGIAPYFATKHAVVGLSESLYLELTALESPVGVSVLCPGFVRTDLMDREPDTVDGPMASLANAMLVDGVASGMPAADVADQVVDAVRARRFWILTHAELRELPLERMRRAAAQTDPTLPDPD